MMTSASSRVRLNPSHLYDVYVEVASPGSPGDDAFILTKYPIHYADQGVLKGITKFIFPCGESNRMSEAVQHVSFVKTDEDGKFTFGYCRHTPKTNTCLCLMTALPWTNFFFKLLDHLANVMNTKPSKEFESLLARTYNTEVPSAGDLFIVESSLGVNKFVHRCHDNTKLPTIQDNRNLLEYFSAVDQIDMMRIFANMLRERRIIFTGTKLNQISSCVFAANLLIYPLHWQFMFFPLIPMLDILGATFPFIAGVPSSSFSKAIKNHIVKMEDVVVMDIDSKVYYPPKDASGNVIDDLMSLPVEVISVLKCNLKTSNYIGDGLARSFLRAMVVILGNYKAGLIQDVATNLWCFDPQRLLNASTATMKPFIQEVFIDNATRVQLFQQFMEERMDLLNCGAVVDDEFEQETKVFELKIKSKTPGDYIFNAVSGGFTGLQKKVFDFTKDQMPSTSMRHIQSPMDAASNAIKKLPFIPKEGKREKLQKRTGVSERAKFHSEYEPTEVAQEAKSSNFVDDPDIKVAAMEISVISTLPDIQSNGTGHEKLRPTKSSSDVPLLNSNPQCNNSSSGDLMIFEATNSEQTLDDFDPLKNIDRLKINNYKDDIQSLRLDLNMMPNVQNGNPTACQKPKTWETFE